MNDEPTIWLGVDDIAQLLEVSGLPHSPRSVERYVRLDDFPTARRATPNGNRSWNRAAVELWIGTRTEAAS